MRDLRIVPLIVLACLVAGCTATQYRQQIDRQMSAMISQKQLEALGRTEPFTIERPADTLRRRLLVAQGLPYLGPASLGTKYVPPIEHWPDDDYLAISEESPEGTILIPAETLILTLNDALQIAARSSQEYQTQKEMLFRACLRLELERDMFRSTFSGILKGTLTHDRSDADGPTGVTTDGLGEAALDVSRKFQSGATLTTKIGLDIARMFSPADVSSKSIYGDATITIPLMRGSGRHIVTEPMIQAERSAVYAIYDFERFKRTFAVRIASDYFEVLRQVDRVHNEEENYRSLIASARRARRLADAGLVSEVQVDQAKQDELRARDRWISAQTLLERRLDTFKTTMGLPPDARIDLDRTELGQLTESVKAIRHVDEDSTGSATAPGADAPIELRQPTREGGGPFELEPPVAVQLALNHRLDLRRTYGEVYDAQRAVVVAADALRAEVTLFGSASIGERRTAGMASSDDAEAPSFNEGTYTGMLTINLPLERTAEQIMYRNRLIDLERSVREVQTLEDRVKLEVRNKLRDLLESREALQIQSRATVLAERRVKSSNLFLQAGRVQIRDLLEAQEALLSSQNALTSAMVTYRVAELELQRDLGLLEVDEQGIWREFDPTKGEHE